jgi:4-hydroxy-3-polyprenylbenzoate decarboxylase
VFERLDLTRDLHFYTKTSIDTLDYSGETINEGSKLVIAAYGDKIRNLKTELPNCLTKYDVIKNPLMVMAGVVALSINAFTNYTNAKTEIQQLAAWVLENKTEFEGIVQLVIYDDFIFTPNSKNLNDYVWITYTRSNPSHDIYGVDEVYENKHWGCKGPMIIDARKKPHHAPELKILPETQKSIERFFAKGASLEKWS